MRGRHTNPKCFPDHLPPHRKPTTAPSPDAGPPAQSAPDPHDEENMDARSDETEMEQVTNKFLQRLEKQEKKGFKDLATLLS